MDPHDITPGTSNPSVALDPSGASGPSDPSAVPPAEQRRPTQTSGGGDPEPTESPEVRSSLLDPTLDRLGPPVGAARFIPADRTHAPGYLFLIVVSIVTLASDLGSKYWAEKNLDSMPSRFELWKDHVGFVLAQNRGGAWGLLQSTNENVRRPFFLLVSAAAIAFIVTLYRRLLPTQRALKWGLPLVLGGALGNVFDRIRYGHVIDFIDVHTMYKDRDHHWPTFNVADIAICVGVGLMAVDMFTSKRPRRPSTVSVGALEPPVPATANESLAVASAADGSLVVEPSAPASDGQASDGPASDGLAHDSQTHDARANEADKVPETSSVDAPPPAAKPLG